MSNNVKIFYNNSGVFDGIAPTPFVSFSQDFIDFGNKWNQVTNISLEGQITGKFIGQASSQFLYYAHQDLINRFKQNYKSFKIIQDNETLFETNKAIIKSINVEESSWNGFIPFTIEITAYEENLFSNYYGIVEPEETFSFSDEDGEMVEFKHFISAKGIVTDNKNAIQNAKEWVEARALENNKINPILVKNSFNNYLLQSKKEVIDRFNGTYSQEYIYKKSVNSENPTNAFLEYTVDFNWSLDEDLITAKINGSLYGNNVEPILLDEYFNIEGNFFNICNELSLASFNKNLNPRPISNFVSEQLNENKLNFTVEYNNDFSDEIVNDYTVNMDQDVLSCITTVNVSTTISCKYGDQQTRWAKVQGFFGSLGDDFWYSLASSEHLKEYGFPSLNKSPKSVSTTYNEYNAIITHNVTFDNKKQDFSENLLNLESNVSINPSIKQHVPNTSAFETRKHNIQTFNSYSRTSLRLSVTAVARIDKSVSDAESAANFEINSLRGDYVVRREDKLEERNVTINEDLKSVTINETWSFNGLRLQ